jgi:hypothetical protein
MKAWKLVKKQPFKESDLNFKNLKYFDLQFPLRLQTPIPGPGLPVGIFFNQKSHFGYILEGLGTESVGIFLRPFGIFYGQLVYVMVIW